MKFTSEIINKLPKAELHCLLDGSLRIKTIIELAENQGVEFIENFIYWAFRKIIRRVYKEI